MNTSIAETPSRRARQETSWYRYYAIGILVLVGTFSWTDRQLFAILLEPIRRDLSLSDLQLGLVGGTAFGLFYVTVGIPVAWLADRVSRRDIVAVSLGLWSFMTALCGAATGFASLFACRVGVGIGEAGGAAPSQSLVSDTFPARHRALAMGVLYSYIPLGYFLSYAVGGWLSTNVSWRSAFVMFGVPGIVLALLMRTTVREPPRPQMPALTESRGSDGASIIDRLRWLFRLRALRFIPLAGAAHGLGMSGAAIWLPAYFIRVQHLSAADAGMSLALIMGGGGLIGVLAGGWLVDRVVRRTRDPRWYPWACAAFIAGTLPLTVAAFLAHSGAAALLLFIVPTILNHMILGPVFALVQGLAGPTRRAMGAAYYLFLVNLVSAGLGPLLIGWLSDLFRAHFHEASLRYSLLCLIPAASGLAVALFLLAARAVRAEYSDREIPA